MRFAALDALRGIAALVVVVFHIEVVGGIYAGSLHQVPFIEHGFLFVDFFFVLSGFVLTHTYFYKITNANELLIFVIRRFGRVYPLHLFFLVLFIGLELVKLYAYSKGVHADHAPFEGEYSVPSIFTNIFLIQALDIHNVATWNGPSWSISLEFYTYFIFSLFVIFFRRKTWVFVTTSGCFAAFSVFMIYKFSERYIDTTFDYGIFRCLYGFFWGAITYIAVSKIRSKVIASSRVFLLIEAAASFACILFVNDIGDGPRSLLAPLVFSLAVAVFSFEKGWISSLLTKRVPLFLGEISYTIYISHALILVMVGRIFRVLQKKTDYFSIVKYFYHEKMDLIVPVSYGFSNLIVAGILAAIVILCVIVNRWVEVPCRDYFCRVAKRFQHSPVPSHQRRLEHAGKGGFVDAEQRG